jgi:hypothetical protein
MFQKVCSSHKLRFTWCNCIAILCATLSWIGKWSRVGFLVICLMVYVMDPGSWLSVTEIEKDSNNGTKNKKIALKAKN